MEIVLFRIHTRPDIDQVEYERAFMEMVSRASQLARLRRHPSLRRRGWERTRGRPV